MTDRTKGPTRQGGALKAGGLSAARRRRAGRYLANAPLLEEAGPPRLLTMSLILICALVAGLIAWSAVSVVPESVSAQAEIRPVGSVHVVQHLEGGIVAAVLVRDGDTVAPGQPLLRMAPAARESELHEMRARRAGLALRAERLRALIDDREPVFLLFGDDYPGLVEDQQSAYLLARRATDNQLKILSTRVAQRESEVKVLKEQATALMSQVALVEEELSMRKTLLDKKLVSRIVYLETEREYNRLLGRLAEVAANRERAELAVSEAVESLREFESRRRNELVTELAGATAELAQVDEALARLQDRVVRLDVSSPVAGVVNGLQVKTAGAVVEPGAGLLEIVPTDTRLHLEAKIAARDIGHVSVGQKVDIKISSFDFSRFGSVQGRVEQIAANSFADKEGQVFYRAEVSLAKDYVSAAEGGTVRIYPLRPGMTAQADIVTGSRSILEYLLKPVYLSLSKAFSER